MNPTHNHNQNQNRNRLNFTSSDPRVLHREPTFLQSEPIVLYFKPSFVDLPFPPNQFRDGSDTFQLLLRNKKLFRTTRFISKGFPSTITARSTPMFIKHKIIIDNAFINIMRMLVAYESHAIVPAGSH